MAGLSVAARYIHVISAIALVGGLIFWAACLLPATRLLDQTFRRSVMELALRRFRHIVLLSVIGLLASGIYNWVRMNDTYSAMRTAAPDGAPIGQILIGVKALLGLALFAVIALAGIRADDTPHQRRWLATYLHLSAIIVLLGAVLRHLRLEYLTDLVRSAAP